MVKKKWSRLYHFILSVIAFFVATVAAGIYLFITVGAKVDSTPEAARELVARFAYVFLSLVAFIPFVIIATKINYHIQQNLTSTAVCAQLDQMHMHMQIHITGCTPAISDISITEISYLGTQAKITDYSTLYYSNSYYCCIIVVQTLIL